MDVNNLCGWVFIYNYIIYVVGYNNLDGYILEVDPEYPKELHELHNNYSLVPERLEINHDMLSKYSSIIENKYDTKIGGVNKLVPILGIKVNMFF